VSGFSARLTPSELEAVKSNQTNLPSTTQYNLIITSLRATHHSFIHLMVGFEFVVQSNLK
jgi:hypothetical protein